MGTIQIVAAAEKDIPVIRSIAEAVWPGTYGKIISDEQIRYMLEKMYAPEVLAAQLAGGHRFVFALEDDKILGFAGFEQTEKEKMKLHKLYILPEAQGKGVGALLILFIKDCAIQAGVKMLHLNVNKYNAAYHFYLKSGFTVLYEEDLDIGNGYFMNDYVMGMNL